MFWFFFAINDVNYPQKKNNNADKFEWKFLQIDNGKIKNAAHESRREQNITMAFNVIN